MRFKLLIFDLDGTAIPNKSDGLPSTPVVKAVEEAKRAIDVSAATGRGITMARPILKKLKLVSPCVISGGTQIVNPQTEKILWEKQLTKNQVKEIIGVCLPYPYQVFFGEETGGGSAKTKNVKRVEKIVYVMNVKNESPDLPSLIKKLNRLKNISAHEVKAWTKGCTDIHITHKEATKKFAMKVLHEIIGVKEKEVISVGDSDNDLPLFEKSGFKVAVGNASNKIKRAADYIAPSVEKDGLVEVINKFILSN